MRREKVGNNLRGLVESVRFVFASEKSSAFVNSLGSSQDCKMWIIATPVVSRMPGVYCTANC